MMSNGNIPFVRILEQPLSRGARFRYDSEGRYSGSIFGVGTTSTRKNYPTIEIVNHKGAALVIVSCVSKDPPYSPHPHNLVGKMKEIVGGVCYFKTMPNESIIVFPHLGIQCVKKKDIEKSLTLREQHKVDPFNTGFQHKLHPDNIDLNCIRLCFQVYLEDQETGKLNIRLEPVVSEPIYDKKRSAELVIRYVSHCSATVDSGQVIIILCEKATEDIKVRFFQKEKKWETIAETVPPHYHKQAAIIVKTPKYWKTDISEPVSVQLQLIRVSDGETSEAQPFEFLPVDADDPHALRRKRLKCKETPRSLVLKHLQAEASTTASQVYGVQKNKPEYSVIPTFLCSTTNNNRNMFDATCISFNNVTNNFQIPSVNPEEPINKTQEVNYPTSYQPSMLVPKRNNNPNSFNETCASFNNVTNNSQFSCINQQESINKTQQINYPTSYQPSMLGPRMNNNQNGFNANSASFNSVTNNSQVSYANKEKAIHTTQEVNYPTSYQSSMHHQKINNNLNRFNTNCTPFNNVTKNSQISYVNQEEPINKAQEINYQTSYQSSMLRPKINNNLNGFSETCAPFNNVTNNFQISCVNPEEPINKTQEINYSTSFQPSLLHQKINNNLNSFNANCASFNSVTNNSNFSCINPEEARNKTQEINYPTSYQPSMLHQKINNNLNSFNANCASFNSVTNNSQISYVNQEELIDVSEEFKYPATHQP